MSYEDVNRREQRLLGEALTNIRERAGLTQDQAAAAFGIGSGAGWGKYERGISPKILALGTQMKLTAALGLTTDDLARERNRLANAAGAEPEPGLVEAPTPFRPRQAPATPAPGLVPVYGLAHGQGDRAAIATGAELRWIAMHPDQRNYPRAGALEVVGESMYPRWKPRELAYFVFDLPPRIGDDAVVEFLDGTATINEYLGRTRTHLMLRRYYPEHRDFDVPLTEVKAIHAVVG